MKVIQRLDADYIDAGAIRQIEAKLLTIDEEKT
jgi:hypothetical protein